MPLPISLALRSCPRECPPPSPLACLHPQVEGLWQIFINSRNNKNMLLDTYIKSILIT